MGLNFIYSLSDPRDGRVRYIGVTCWSLAARLGTHIRTARRGENTYRARWVRDLLVAGIRPIIAEIERTENRNREIHWIAYHRENGFDLVNTTSGGDGPYNLPPEVRAKISAASKGRIASPETRAKMSAAQKGHLCSDSTKARLRQINLGIKRGPHSQELIAKMSAAKMGHAVSAETRAKIAASLTGRKLGKRKQCPHGHEYLPESTRINVRGHQECLICERANYHRRKMLKIETDPAPPQWPV